MMIAPISSIVRCGASFARVVTSLMLNIDSAELTCAFLEKYNTHLIILLIDRFNICVVKNEFELLTLCGFLNTIETRMGYARLEVEPKIGSFLSSPT